MVGGHRLHGVELTYLADVLQRIVDGSFPVNRLDALLPWNWTAAEVARAA